MTVISTPLKSFDAIGVFSSFVADQERYTASPRKVWRRARDSNPHGPCGPVDFKSTALPVEASPPFTAYPFVVSLSYEWARALPSGAGQYHCAESSHVCAG